MEVFLTRALDARADALAQTLPFSYLLIDRSVRPQTETRVCPLGSEEELSTNLLELLRQPWRRHRVVLLVNLVATVERLVAVLPRCSRQLFGFRRDQLVHLPVSFVAGVAGDDKVQVRLENAELAPLTIKVVDQGGKEESAPGPAPAA